MSGSESDEMEQEDILARLEAYGDSMLDNSSSRKPQKRRKEHLPLDSSAALTVDPSMKKKRKKKKKNNAESANVNRDSNSDVPEISDSLNSNIPGHKHLQRIREALNLDSYVELVKAKEAKAKMDRSNTVSSKSKGRKRREPEVVVYEGPPRKKENKYSEDGQNPKKAKEKREVFDLKRARYDVKKLGISGFDTARKEQAQESLAIELGAVPRKNKHVNYKTLMQQKKTEHEIQLKNVEMEKQMGYRISSQKKKSIKRDRNDIGGVDGQIGKYRTGVQFLRKDDISKVTKRKR